ncbi:MAG: hypothetical protein KAH77_03165 [Thiomargarita sp.]|nr:hypothetical protein [Thiomargarita sp.]
MNILPKIFGSKYDKTIPYTYEAIVNIMEDDDAIKISYMADKICTLINLLKKRQVDPKTVTMFEIYNGKDTLIPADCYMTEDDKWFPKTKLCRPMTSRYGEAKTDQNCQFRDRNNRICGPG